MDDKKVLSPMFGAMTRHWDGDWRVCMVLHSEAEMLHRLTSEGWENVNPSNGAELPHSVGEFAMYTRGREDACATTTRRVCAEDYLRVYIDRTFAVDRSVVPAFEFTVAVDPENPFSPDLATSPAPEPAPELPPLPPVLDHYPPTDFEQGRARVMLKARHEAEAELA